MDRPRVRSLVPLVQVADVAASIDFYAKLGFEMVGSFTPPGESGPSWAELRSDGAELMLGRASGAMAGGAHSVLFYVYCEEVAAVHEALAAAGLEPGPIVRPFYNQGGEFRLVDPDGHAVMVAPL